MSRKTSIILSILPLVFLTLIVFRFSLDLPYWDQWEFVPLLQKSYQGNLSFNDFWVPHNVHRPVFPRLMMLGLARLTNWNIRYELALNILLAIGIYTLLIKAGDTKNKEADAGRPCFLSTPTVLEHHEFAGGERVGESGRCGKKSWPTSASVIAIIVFSLTQWENWVWGWQIQIFLNVFAICLGFYFLTKSYNNKIYFIASILCGIIATFSFGNGLLFWPIGLFILTSLAKSDLAKLIWILISILIYAIYLPSLPTQFDLFGIINNILLYLSYVTAYLGAPVFGLQPLLASIFGIVGLLIFVYYWKQNTHGRGIFFVSLGLYAVLSALFTGLGRYNLGGLQAISSRYTTFANLLWLSNIVFLYRKTTVTGGANRIIRQARPPKRSFDCVDVNHESNLNVGGTRAISIIILVIFLITITSLYRIKTVIKRYNDLSTAQTALFTGTNDILLEKLYYSGEVVKERSGFLRSFNLSLFRK